MEKNCHFYSRELNSVAIHIAYYIHRLEFISRTLHFSMFKISEF